MSNAMRFGKRTLAGVAAGALALGALTIASAPAASAKPNVKPKATATAGVSAVRATGVSPTALSIPPAKMAWRGTSLFGSGSPYIDLITAPTGGATMTVWQSDGVTLDDTVTLLQNGESVGPAYLIGDDTGVYFNVDTAGLYSGIIANGADTVSFSFTTAGAPVALTLTPPTQNVLVGGVGTVTVALRDAAGNVTQPQTVDSVTVASSGDDTVAFPTLTGVHAGKLQFGIYDDTIATQTAGTSTITATPLGTLPASGLTPQTVTLVKSGTVSATTVKSITVVAPVKQVQSLLPAPPAAPQLTTAIPEGTTSVTVLVDDTTIATAGNNIRLKAVLSNYPSAGATLNGTATYTQYVDVTTDAKKQATATFTLGGSAVLSPSLLTVSQVNVYNSPVSPAASNAITQTTPAVSATGIAISPDDSQVAKIGTVTPVSVTVTDQFGTPQSNWTVQVFRGATVSGGLFLNQGTTDVAGKTTVNVTNAAGIVSGTTEKYSIYTFYGPQNATDNSTLWITYTTDGNISALNVVPNVTGASAISNLTTPATLAAIPYMVVPYGGVAGTGNINGIYTVASATGTAAGNVTMFTPTATPANNVTVTVGAGAKVWTAPGQAWDGGAQTVTVSSGTPVFVWATKADEHNVVFTSGGLTATGKVKARTVAAAAYNIAVTPDTQKIEKGGFGTATITLTDVFGNAVPGADDSNSVTIAASGAVLLGGYNNTQNVTVGATGSATVTVIAGNVPGNGALTATPKAGDTAPAFVAGYVKPAGAPDPKLSSVASVEVTNASPDRSITITDSGRTTVSGKPGVYANGSTNGFAAGETLKVWVRFPGQTEFSEGSAKPAIAADGSFEWSRKTGKKTYVYFTNNDGVIKSKGVVIPAN